MCRREAQKTHDLQHVQHVWLHTCAHGARRAWRKHARQNARQIRPRRTGRRKDVGNKLEELLETYSREHISSHFRAPAANIGHNLPTLDKCSPSLHQLGPKLAKLGPSWETVGQTLVEFVNRRPTNMRNVFPGAFVEYMSSIFPVSFPRPVRWRVAWRAYSSILSRRPPCAAGAFFSICCTGRVAI